jgi:histidyl-tRNA synthetase
MPLIDKSLYNELTDALKGFGIKNSKIENLIRTLKTNKINIIEEFCINDNFIKNEFIKFKYILDLLKTNFKIEFKIKLGIVRGLDYYNGLVFEIESPNLGAEKQICGGGEYDLINTLNGKDTPTAGFAIGFDRVLISLEMQKYMFPKRNIDFYIIPLNKDMIDKSLELLDILRKNKYIVDMDLLRRGIGKSLKYASSVKALKAIIIGPDELDNNSITIKNMITGEQNIVNINKFIKSL